MVCQLCQVMWSMSAVIARPRMGSAIGAPSATAAALRTGAQATEDASRRGPARRRVVRFTGSHDPPIGVVLGSVEPELEIELCFDVMPTPVGVEAQLEGEGSARARVHLELAASQTEVLVLLDHANRSPGVVRRAGMSHPFPSCNAVVRNAAMCQVPYGRRAAGLIGGGDHPRDRRGW